jgi:succinyl-CoA synthetase alpha subunit
LIVAITEGRPIADLDARAARAGSVELAPVGPNCPGLLTPGQAKVGIIPATSRCPARLAWFSRSGTLTYEAIYALTQRGHRPEQLRGIGGDPINGTSFIDVLGLFEDDPETEKIVLIGEIGGTDEQKAAAFIAQRMTKPVVAFIAGRKAPEGRTMAMRGRLSRIGRGHRRREDRAFPEVGVRVRRDPDQIADLIAR